jgi:hypothetical protein
MCGPDTTEVTSEMLDSWAEISNSSNSATNQHAQLLMRTESHQAKLNDNVTCQIKPRQKRNDIN